MIFRIDREIPVVLFDRMPYTAYTETVPGLIALRRLRHPVYKHDLMLVIIFYIDTEKTVLNVDFQRDQPLLLSMALLMALPNSE